MRIPRPLFVVLLVLLAGEPAVALGAAPASGTYEAYSPLTDGPVGPIAAASAATLLGHWLEVTTSGATTRMVFAPERRIVWTMTYGPTGLVRKVTTVDGAPWTTSDFGYDAHGHLQSKTVSGEVKASFVYRTAPDGRVIERLRTGSSERWTVRYDATGATAETWDVKDLVRRDRFDASRRLLTTEVDVGGAPVASIRYDRAGDGTMRSVVRRIPGAADRPADPAHVEGDLTSLVLPRIATAHAFERHEVLLLTGAPVTHSVTGTGVTRRTEDLYDGACKMMNTTSTLVYDAADLAQNGKITCICGFCVAMDTPAIAGDVLGTDEHWTRGPWVRLDGAVDVTVDHRVATPGGSRLAGTLAPGDVVLGADGLPRVLRTVEPLPDSAERLGVNVRTRSGSFAAGGLRFESEAGRECRER